MITPTHSSHVCTIRCTHGTLPWTAKHQRRAVLYKLSPGHMAFSGGGIETNVSGFYIPDAPAWHTGLTAEQHEKLIGPGHSGRTASRKQIVSMKHADSATKGKL